MRGISDMPAFPVSPSLRSWVEVDPGALRHNLAVVRRSIGPRPGILAVIKANAYGHGTEQVAKALAHDVEIFGVANLSEARAVAAAETGRRIMLLSPCLPSEWPEAVARGFIVTVSGAEEAEKVAACGAADIHFKVDTGMGRVGVWSEQALGEITRVADRVRIHSISTHLPCSDEDEEFTRNQLTGFSHLVARFREIVPGAKIHSLNSAGILKFPDHAEDLVRAGLVLYGSSPCPEFQEAFRPALTWKARITLVKDLPAGTGICYGRTFITPRPTRTAVLAVGYADGFPRQASGKGAEVLIRGTRCPLLGRVTMDQIVVDVTDLEKVEVGEAAVLIGEQDGKSITAAELAGQADTIAWDIFTGIKGRVARVYPE